jgi:hypothetical protein
MSDSSDPTDASTVQQMLGAVVRLVPESRQLAVVLKALIRAASEVVSELDSRAAAPVDLGPAPDGTEWEPLLFHLLETLKQRNVTRVTFAKTMGVQLQTLGFWLVPEKPGPPAETRARFRAWADGVASVAPADGVNTLAAAWPQVRAAVNNALRVHHIGRDVLAEQVEVSAATLPNVLRADGRVPGARTISAFQRWLDGLPPLPPPAELAGDALVLAVRSKCASTNSSRTALANTIGIGVPVLEHVLEVGEVDDVPKPVIDRLRRWALPKVNGAAAD